MSEKWRTVQIFLDSNQFEIAEVEINPEVEVLQSSIKQIQGIRCNCSLFRLTKGCKHVQFVLKSMIKNNGHYAVQISNELDNEMILEAMNSPEEFRQLIIHNAKIEVIK